MARKPRKIIQVTCSDEALYVVCEDGTLWVRTDHGWKYIDAPDTGAINVFGYVQP